LDKSAARTDGATRLGLAYKRNTVIGGMAQGHYIGQRATKFGREQLSTAD